MFLQLIIIQFRSGGFQFYTFLCDSKCSNHNRNDWLSFSIYMVRMVIFDLCFVLAFAQSFKVDDKLNFRYQYTVLLVVSYVPLISEFILHETNIQNIPSFICSGSAAFLAYYLSLLCNLSISFFLLCLHIFSYQEDDFRLDFPELLKAKDLSYILLQNEDCRKSF